MKSDTLSIFNGGLNFFNKKRLKNLFNTKIYIKK